MCRDCRFGGSADIEREIDICEERTPDAERLTADGKRLGTVENSRN